MFVGTGIGLAQTIGFFATSVAAIFISLDNVQFFDTPFSILDIFIAIILLEMIMWFVIRFIMKKEKEAQIDAYSYSGGADEYNETIVSSAKANEIDFSDEIVHE